MVTTVTVTIPAAIEVVGPLLSARAMPPPKIRGYDFDEGPVIAESSPLYERSLSLHSIGAKNPAANCLASPAASKSARTRLGASRGATAPRAISVPNSSTRRVAGHVRCAHIEYAVRARFLPLQELGVQVVEFDLEFLAGSISEFGKVAKSRLPACQPSSRTFSKHRERFPSS